MVGLLPSQSPPNDIERQLQTRTYIFGQTCNVLVLDSSCNETRIVFASSEVAPNTAAPLLIFSASNQAFAFSRKQWTSNEERLATLFMDGGPAATNGLDGTTTSSGTYAGAPNLVRFDLGAGSLSAAQLTTSHSQNSRKLVVLSDLNTRYSHQFAGIGYTDAILNYQVPTENAVHAFYSGFDSTHSTELLRIQRKNALTSVGIGTALVRDGVALDVVGGARLSSNLEVFGDLRVHGTMDASLLSGVAVLSATDDRVSATFLPSNVAYLNGLNQIDESFLPAAYRAPYIRGLRNVGIGTRHPQQKLHVQGAVAVSERIGIATTAPTARLHIVDANVAAPAIEIAKVAGNDALRIYGGPAGTTPMFNVTAAGQVGIGTFNNEAGTALHLTGGDLRIDERLFVKEIEIERLECRQGANSIITMGTLITGTDGTTEPSVQVHAPFLCSERIIVPEIQFGGRPLDAEGAIVRFKDSGIHVDGAAIFETQPTIVSDSRVKSDIVRIRSAIESLELIHGYTYHLNSQPETVQGGLLAQEVLAGFPAAVSALADGRLAVHYDGVLALLVEGFHELKATVDRLEQSAFGARRVP